MWQILPWARAPLTPVLHTAQPLSPKLSSLLGFRSVPCQKWAFCTPGEQVACKMGLTLLELAQVGLQDGGVERQATSVQLAHKDILSLQLLQQRLDVLLRACEGLHASEMLCSL